MQFDLFALLLVIFGLIVFSIWKIGQAGESPAVLYSDLSDLEPKTKGFKEKFSILPRYLLLSSLGVFICAFLDPHFSIPSEVKSAELHKIPFKGTAAYFVLDRSGSMNQEVFSPYGTLSKMELLKVVVEQLIRENFMEMRDQASYPLLGLVAFARTADVLSPLTFDYQTILNKIRSIDVASDPTEDGTAIGYAIFKTVNLMLATKRFAQKQGLREEPAFNIQNQVIIIVTDGFQDPNPLDLGNRLRTIELDDAANFAKENGVHLYLINIDPKIHLEQFSPQRRLMQRITALTGGQFYTISQNQDLLQIFDDIEKREEGLQVQAAEKGSEQLVLFKRFSLYPFMIGIGMLLLLTGIVLQSFYFRTIP